jgi:hypothetical protein
MSLFSASLVEEIRARGALTMADIAVIRRAFDTHGVLDAADAEALIMLHRACPTQESCWPDCFVELVTDYLVHQSAPMGYITLEKAEWLANQIAPTGTIATKPELELLINAIDKSRWSPQSLAAFALDQVRRAIVEGTGPLRAANPVPAGTIDEAEVELLKRILYAYGGDENIAITRAEADILFDIDAATQSAQNAESWPDLFVKAVANCAMTASGYAPPSREQALARETWVERRKNAPVDTNALGGMLAAYRLRTSEERAIAVLERQKIEIVTGEEIATADAAWLAERIARDGIATPNEKALIDFLIAHNATVAPEIGDKVGALLAAA